MGKVKRNNLYFVMFIAIMAVFTGCSTEEESSSYPENSDVLTTDDNFVEIIDIIDETKTIDTDIDVLDNDADINDEASGIVVPINNNSFETQHYYYENIADGWETNVWGECSAEFTYLNDGHTGSRSVKVEIKDYINGDAKWFFKPIEIEPGDYTFNDYYRSNVDSKVMVVITTDEGEKEFINLYNAPASEEWTKYESTFIVPEHAESLTVYHLLSQDGYLAVDDYEIKTYHYQGFDNGMITISFDDGWMTNSETALPAMNEYGYKSNQFYAVKYIQEYVDGDALELIQPFIDAGHEIGSHTINHYDLSKLPENEMVAELVESKIFLENYLMTDINYFAAPYGIYDVRVNNRILEHYKAHRTVDFGFNSKDNFYVERLTCMPVVSITTIEDVQEWVDKAKEENLWLILLFHNIKNNPGYYGATPEIFAECMEVIDNSGMPVLTISEALEQISSQTD